MLKEYFLAFVPIFVAVDAIGMLPVFMALSQGMTVKQKAKLIRHSTFTALLVALAFLIVGRLVFEWLGITIGDFLVAGGAILFILSIRDLVSTGKPAVVSDETMGVVPLAVPLIAGPAVLTTSLVVLNSFGLMPALVSVVLNIALCGVILSSSSALSRILGKTGSMTLSKISSLLLGTIGVMLIRRGIFDLIRIGQGR